MARSPTRREWEIEFTPQAAAWIGSLGTPDAERIGASLARLRVHGPSLGRPSADSVRGSRHRNMKELRSKAGNLRALFAFDPQRRAVILLGGDKTNDWNKWYARNIPAADKLYDKHLRATGRGNGWQKRPTRAGALSAESSR